MSMMVDEHDGEHGDSAEVHGHGPPDGVGPNVQVVHGHGAGGRNRETEDIGANTFSPCL